MILFLDTTDKNAVFLALAAAAKKTFLCNRLFRSSKARVDVLCSLEKLLTSRTCALKKIKGIIVVSGPGAFSAIRSGVSIANALSYALHISVVGVQRINEEARDILLARGCEMLKKNKKNHLSLVIPEYGKEPNITVSKKKFA